MAKAGGSGALSVTRKKKKAEEGREEEDAMQMDAEKGSARGKAGGGGGGGGGGAEKPAKKAKKKIKAEAEDAILKPAKAGAGVGKADAAADAKKKRKAAAAAAAALENGAANGHAETPPDETDGKRKERKRKKADADADEGAAAGKRRAKGEGEGAGEGAGAGEDPLGTYGLSDKTVAYLRTRGISDLFEIQKQCLGAALAGRDVTGKARTGSGKTLAFALPVVDSLALDGPVARGQPPRALVLAPTRELAKQVAEEFENVGRPHRLRSLCIYGGSPYAPQEAALARGVDVVIGTPGRVKDLMQKGRLELGSLRFRILDEADEMLNMGFKDDVELILSAVRDAAGVQTLLFSATMPRWVADISRNFQRADKLQVDLVGSQETRASSTVRQCLLMCDWSAVQTICADLISVHNPAGRTVVFAETKRDCGDIATHLAKRHSAVALHGDIEQRQREVTLRGFRDFKYNVLVATDVAARGLDITGIELVIQVEPPKDVESYIHRSGRTGRAGASGTCILLCGQRKASLAAMIERSAKLKFDRIHAPRPRDLAVASADEALKRVEAVKPSVAALFMDQARRLLAPGAGDGEGGGAAQVLAAAIACIAGHGDLTSRSMLTSREGYTTLLFKSNGTHIRTPSFVFSVIRRLMSEEEANEVHRMTLLADGYGAVFDLPSKKAAALVEAAGGARAPAGSISECEELPELAVAPQRAAGGGGGFGGRGGRGGRGGAFSPRGGCGRGGRGRGRGRGWGR